MRSPVSVLSLPSPTASMVPVLGRSLLVSGRKMPLLVRVSASSRRTMILSCKGLIEARLPLAERLSLLLSFLAGAGLVAVRLMVFFSIFLQCPGLQADPAATHRFRPESQISDLQIL